MNIEQARFNMIEQQIRPWEVLDPTVLDLLSSSSARDFVPGLSGARLRRHGNSHRPGPGHAGTQDRGQAPARIGSTEDRQDLEIGSGSGYMAPSSGARRARGDRRNQSRIGRWRAAQPREAGVTNVAAETGDEAQGLVPPRPPTTSLSSRGVAEIPETLLRQLRVGGRLAAIVGEAPVMEAQLVTCTAPGVYNTVNLFETVALLPGSGQERLRVLMKQLAPAISAGLAGRFRASRAGASGCARTLGIETRHLAGAQLIPMREVPACLGNSIRPRRRWWCVCHHGACSLQVALFLERNGFSQVLNLDGGVGSLGPASRSGHASILTMRAVGFLLLSLLAVGSAGAADLLQIYREAVDNDPSFAGARARPMPAGKSRPRVGRFVAQPHAFREHGLE